MNKVSIEGLMEVIKRVVDPRSTRGRRYELYSLLGLALYKGRKGKKGDKRRSDKKGGERGGLWSDISF